MNTRTLLSACLSIALLGCDILAPVVTTFPDDEEVQVVCEEPPTCDALLTPPPLPPQLASLRGPDGACGTSGRTPQTLEVTSDTTIDADALGCVELTVEVEGASAEARVLLLEGTSLTGAHVHVHAAGRPVRLEVQVARVEQSEISVDGAVRVTLHAAHTTASRVVLDGEAPLAPAQLFVLRGAASDLEVLGDRGEVHLVDALVSVASFAVGSLVVERGDLRQAQLEADVIELLDARLLETEVDVAHLVAASGVLEGLHLRRCGDVALSELAVTRSFIAACDTPLAVRGVSFEHSTVAASVLGTGGHLRHAVFGGAQLDLPDAEVTDTALCGTSSVDVRALTCVRCGEAAPLDLCGEVSGTTSFCPGLCASSCSATGQSALSDEACAS